VVSVKNGAILAGQRDADLPQCPFLGRAAEQIDDFFDLGFGQRFASLAQFAVDVGGRLDHPLVGLLRTADEKKILTGCHALVPVVRVKPNAEESDYLFPFLPSPMLGHLFPLPVHFNYTRQAMQGSMTNALR
jgi:hypothetical protein